MSGTKYMKHQYFFEDSFVWNQMLKGNYWIIRLLKRICISCRFQPHRFSVPRSKRNRFSYWRAFRTGKMLIWKLIENEQVTFKKSLFEFREITIPLALLAFSVNQDSNPRCSYRVFWCRWRVDDRDLDGRDAAGSMEKTCLNVGITRTSVQILAISIFQDFAPRIEGQYLIWK